jgi:hypothetical protein
MTCPDKVEPKPKLSERFNIESEISNIMQELNVAIRRQNETIKTGMDLLEMARCSSYTESMAEIETLLHEAKAKLAYYFHTSHHKINKIIKKTQNKT